jgi:serine/threonine protein kinase/Flp pilus assembly protein TadD
MIGQSISHYKILEKIGEGGMGVVYKAQDTTLDRLVAIKFLPQDLSGSPENKTRFMQEAKAAAALNHPNILGVYEVIDEAGTMCLVMELLDGQTLKSYMTNLKTGPGIPVPQALAFAIQVADGLKAAHAKNIVHRDIKPQNIMLTASGGVKIMDFGLAKLKSSATITRTGSSLGTLSYMSPEQARGVPVDHRSDIWSLGVVLYEMLTAELPFKAEHEAGISYLIINEDATQPSTLDLKIPHQVDNVVKKMLEKDPGRRYQNVGEVLSAIDAVKKEIETATSTAKTKAIAVLPFDNISPEKESDYFCDGLMGELIANLSRLKDIRVVSRTSSMQYKGTKKDIKTIGRELDARYVIEGNVRKFQDNLRITAQLIDVETDAQLWAETYKGKLADVFDIQEQVSKQIVDALMVKLTPREQVALTKRSTVNAEAFDYYLRARGFLYRTSKSNLQIAIQLFQKAIELDTRYAAAYAGLGEAYAYLYQYIERKDVWLEKAIESSLKAQLYDPTLSEAFAALAVAYFNKKVFDDALTAGHKAIELDPNNHIAHWILGRIYHNMDQDKKAVDLFKKVLALNPDFYTAYGDLRMMYERLGEKEKKDETLQDSLRMYPRYLLQHPDDARAHMFHAFDLAQTGKVGEAKVEAAKAIELSPGDTVALYNAACFYASLSEKKLAVETLKNAIIAGWVDYEWIKRDPDLENIRSEPGYVELLKGK